MPSNAITIDYHALPRSPRYAAQLVRTKAQDAALVALRTMDPVTAERARLESAAWRDLHSLIRAFYNLTN